jgi:hypothetical protein
MLSVRSTQEVSVRDVECALRFEQRIVVPAARSDEGSQLQGE